MAIDRQGQVWVGNGETIDVSDTQHHQFHPFAAKTAASSSGASICCHRCGRKPLVWRLFRHPSTYSSGNEHVRDHHSASRRSSAFRGSSGTVWAITLKGLYGIPPSQNGKRIPVLEPDAALNKENLKSISEAPDKTLWVGSQGGLFHRSASGWHRVQLHNAEIGSSLPRLQRAQGDIWVAGKFGRSRCG